MSVFLSLLGASVLAIGTASASEPGDAAAEVQYGVCVHCHGAHGEGRPELSAPRIGDLEPDYIAQQLKAFRDGGNGAHPEDTIGHPMRAVALGLTDAQIETIAAFSAGLEPELRSPGAAVDGGEQAYAACASCHGADARGVAGTGAPDLLYQDSDYLVRQMKKYRDGQRGGAGAPPMAAVMVGFSQGLDDATIEDIAGHIASLRPERPPVENPEVTLSVEEGLAAFADIYQVSQHPRCMNCHPEGDAPLQTDESIPHNMGITRFSPNQGLHCSTCHAAVGAGDGLAPLPPADSIWSLAPKQMVFENRTPAQLCGQLTDPEINGGRGLTVLAEHIEQDHLLQTSWHSGRPAPHISHEELVKRFETWGAAGGPCPE